MQFLFLLLYNLLHQSITWLKQSITDRVCVSDEGISHYLQLTFISIKSKDTCHSNIQARSQDFEMGENILEAADIFEIGLKLCKFRAIKSILWKKWQRSCRHFRDKLKIVNFGYQMGGGTFPMFPWLRACLLLTITLVCF